MQVDDKKYKEMELALAKVNKQKEDHKKYSSRRNAWRTLMLVKAEAAHIKVSEAEVDAYLKK